MDYSLHDAHLHLADEQLAGYLPEVLDTFETVHLRSAVIVGTSPQDWAKVLELCAGDKRFIPAVGLHPWEVNTVESDWRELFLEFLRRGVRVIGEIGLDQWIDDYDIKRQEEAFRWQMSLATERNLPTSIHCLKTHEPLLRILRDIDLPKRGFKLHAYNGPVDTVKPLLELGAHFSFNAGQLKPNAKRAPEIIKQVPDDRLLIETDAPNFQPPETLREFSLEDADLCHPGNIRAAYRAIAELRRCPVKEMARQVEANFERYFAADE